jgi:hypothetical protein
MHCANLVALVAMNLFLAAPAVEQPSAPKKNKSEIKYSDSAIVTNDGKAVTGITGIADGNMQFDKLKSGYTLVPADTADPNKSLVIVSVARDPKNPNAGMIRVVAVDRNGKRHEASSQSVANASGTKHDVVTLVSEYAIAKKDVREWIIQRGRRCYRANLGMVVARGIIDEDAESEEPLLGTEQP